ncbi:MAG: F0F1 ATP synthase subunit gamma [Bacteroidota bacterium]|nr:F0F1 ATP synthase subunit gamma [Bacteroidota bacterium]
MDTLESLRRKIGNAMELGSVVRTMKAMAALNIGQYEMVTMALHDYYHTIELGIMVYLKHEKISIAATSPKSVDGKPIIAIVFGSDQGLVGGFNELLAHFTTDTINGLHGKKEIWAVGERIQNLLADKRLNVSQLFSVPNSVTAITSLVAKVLVNIDKERQKEGSQEFYIFHNRSKSATSYEPDYQRLWPLDNKWQQGLEHYKWPTNQLPEVIGGMQPTLASLVREYLFVSLYKACAESMASENESRLQAMQRAEKNIDELMDDLNKRYHQLRQSSIDEELFDIVSGFQALKEKRSNIL